MGYCSKSLLFAWLYNALGSPPPRDILLVFFFEIPLQGERKFWKKWKLKDFDSLFLRGRGGVEEKKKKKKRRF